MLSPEHKKAISKGLKKAHKKGNHPGWKHVNENARMSYPELYFRRILIRNNFYENYTIREHHSFGKYFLDFAIIDLKIDIEIDGQQHFRTEEAREHDIKRDEYLEENGWVVYRIAWLELFHSEEPIIKNFLEWFEIPCKSRKYDIKEVLSYKQRKPIYGTREDYTKARKKETEDKYSMLLYKAIYSGVDFEKFGWVQQVSKITGIKPQKVSFWMKRICPDFYEDRCFKRKAPVI